MKQTLLNKARRIPHKRLINVTDEHIELALSWASDEITYSQVSKALNNGSSNMAAYVTLARSLREAVRIGMLK